MLQDLLVHLEHITFLGARKHLVIVAKTWIKPVNKSENKIH